MRALVIDDNEEITTATSFYLESINIPCKVINQGKEGLEVIKKEHSDPDILKIFSQYSTKMPIVAISISGDPKFIQMATKAGAMDYIIKSELGVKRIPRSLHSVANEWIRRANSSETDDMKYYLNQVLEEIGKYRLLSKDQHRE